MWKRSVLLSFVYLTLFINRVGSEKSGAVARERAEKKKKAIEDFERRAREAAQAQQGAAGGGPAVEKGFLNKPKKEAKKTNPKVDAAKAVLMEAFWGKGRNYLVFGVGVLAMHFLGEELGLPRPV